LAPFDWADLVERSRIRFVSVLIWIEQISSALVIPDMDEFEAP